MEWSTDFPINFLPKDISNIFSGEAEFLLRDLEENKLEVIVVPAPEPRHVGHKIRSVVNQNPNWYRELYFSYTNFRRDRCKKALERIYKKKTKLLGFLLICMMQE